MKRTILILVIVTCLPVYLFAQTERTVLFQDDFENGSAAQWEYEDGWQIVQDNGNYVFEGQGHHWAKPLKRDYYSDATFQARFKLIEGGFHFNILFRSGRYFFPIRSESIEFIADTTNVIRLDYPVSKAAWHTVKVSLEANRMEFSLDDSLLVEYEDPKRYKLFGKLAFEGIDHIYVDDILISGDEAFYKAQEVRWVRTGGPLGGIGYDVRIDPGDPNIIYVTDNWAGCHKSYDGGKTWHPQNEDISSRFGPTGDSIPIFCLTVDPNDANTVWCGTFGMRGAYRSTDKGAHWELRANGIPNTTRLTFRSFAVEPGNSNVVYCGAEWGLSEDEIPAGQRSASKGKIYKTIDGGENWLEVLDSNALVRTIIIDPTDPKIVYAATGIFDRDDVQEEGIWKSTDAGATWVHINNGITNLTIGDIEMHPNNSSILLAAAGRLNGFGGGADAERGEILRSVDGGQTWSRSYGGYMGKPFTYVEFDESNPDIVYAAASDRGFYKSVDGGISWFETTYNPPYVNPGHIISIATHKEKPNWLITNSYGGGVFISEDGANSWQDASKGYTGCEITDIAVALDDPMRVYAVARSGTFRSVDGGNNWQGIGAMERKHNNVPSGPLEMRGIAVSSNNSETILATSTHGIFETKNGGLDWNTVKVLLGQENKDEINTIEFAPSNPNVVYAGAMIWGGYKIDRPFPFDPTTPSFGMLKSTDGGKIWEFINNGLESTYKNINHIAVHPTNPDIAFVGTLNSGIYRTTNGGSTWSGSSTGILVPDVRVIAIDPFNPDTLYAGAQRGGIYKSIDGGESWQAIPYGMDPEASIRSIAIDPTNSQIIYAGDWSSGVYRSIDSGQSWRHINDGLRTRAVHKLAISSDGKILYAGTQGEGVFRLVMDERAPLLQAVSPDTGQTIRVARGDRTSFDVTAYDLNGDEIQYKWYLSGDLLSQGTASQLALETDTLSVGDYRLVVSIADTVSTTTVSWAIQVVPLGPASDFDGDGKVEFPDFVLFAKHFRTKQEDPDFDPKYDLNGNGSVDFPDFVLFAKSYGKTADD